MNQGGALRPNIGIATQFAKPIEDLVGLMYRDVLRELKKVYKQTGFDHAMDASIASQARIVLNSLMAKWEHRFNKIAKEKAELMVNRNINYSGITLKRSLKDISEDLTIDTTFRNSMIDDVIKASTLEASNLIKVIPQKFISEVQGQVMRSITTGKGMEDLVPFMKKKYQGNLRHARLVALDQTRKAYQSINTARLKSLGVKNFIWIHSGGGKEPRQNHIRMSGKEYSFDKPPIIGVMYGKEVTGLPGDLPNCRCICKPVINFDLKD